MTDAAEAPKKAYTGTQAVGRAVAIVEQFTVDRPLWRASDLAKATQLNRTTTYRLLSALEAAGWLERAPDSDAYRLGPGLLNIGQRVQRSNRLGDAAQPFLDRLVPATESNVVLAARSGDRLLEIARLDRGGAQPASAEPIPYHASAFGKVILGFVEAADAAALAGDPLPALTPKTITEWRKLKRQLRQIRVSGYAVTRGESAPGAAEVAAPIFDQSGQVIGGVGISGSFDQLSYDRLPGLARKIMQAAAELSKSLGYQGGSNGRW